MAQRSLCDGLVTDGLAESLRSHFVDKDCLISSIGSFTRCGVDGVSIGRHRRDSGLDCEGNEQCKRMMAHQDI